MHNPVELSKSSQLANVWIVLNTPKDKIGKDRQAFIAKVMSVMMPMQQ